MWCCFRVYLDLGRFSLFVSILWVSVDTSSLDSRHTEFWEHTPLLPLWPSPLITAATSSFTKTRNRCEKVVCRRMGVLFCDNQTLCFTALPSDVWLKGKFSLIWLRRSRSVKGLGVELGISKAVEVWNWPVWLASLGASVKACSWLECHFFFAFSEYWHNCCHWFCLLTATSSTWFSSDIW